MRMTGLAVAVLALMGAPLQGQTPRCEGGAKPRADLAISLACEECTIGEFGQSASWSFSREPRVTAVHGAAGRGLETGDEIVRVNGHPITSAQGAAAFGSPEIGRAMVLTVRRGGALRTVQVTPGATCPEASRSMAVVAAGGVLPTVRGSSVRTDGWLGIGFSCSECSIRRSRSGSEWSFSSPPEIYSIDSASPAYRAGLRRGDVVTHVDGVDITKAEAGRRFGTLRPGQTVRLTFRRDGESRTASVQAAEPPARTAVAATTGRSPSAEARALLELQERVRTGTDRLAATAERRAYEQLLGQVRTASERQTQVLTELQARLQQNASSEAKRAAEERLRQVRASTREQQQLINELLARQQEETRRIQELQRELLRASGRVNLVTPSVNLATPPRAPSPAAEAVTVAGSRRLSYSGTLGDADIEVRGPSPVVVTKDGDVTTIQIGENTVTIKGRK